VLSRECVVVELEVADEAGLGCIVNTKAAVAPPITIKAINATTAVVTPAFFFNFVSCNWGGSAV
jgi:hypothetical protein